jgi:hypothetical protein
MVDNKNDKPSKENASLIDSDEFLQSIFREELKAIAAQKKKETASKTSVKTSAVKKGKATTETQGLGRKKAGLQIVTEKAKTVKSSSISQAQVSKPRKVASERNTLFWKPAEEKTAAQVKDDSPEEIRPEEDTDITQIEGRKVGFGGNLALTSDKLKVALLSVLLVAAVALLLSSLGVVDFGQFLGLSEPTKKASNKTRVAKKPLVKKFPPVAAKSTKKTTSRTASDKGISQKRRRIYNRPGKDTVSEERPDIIMRHARPVPSTQEPVIAQKHPKPTTSTQRPIVATQPSKPIASPQMPAVPRQPAKFGATTQESAVTNTPAQPIVSTQEAIGTKKPPEFSTLKVKPVVVKAHPKSEEATRKKAALGREKPFPKDSDPSYPYSVYLGSFKTRDRAERAISKYRKKGLSPYWVKIDLGDKGIWYRVFSEYFEKREHANKFMEKEQIVGSQSRHTRYANLIGIFASQEELDEEKIRLSELGYCPYVIASPSGESLLYVGAFYQKARAKRQHAELASKGIESHVVER